MKQEMEMALRLLEKDVHEKQDTVVSLRRQMDDIKAINLDIYHKLQVSNLHAWLISRERLFFYSHFLICAAVCIPLRLYALHSMVVIFSVHTRFHHAYVVLNLK